MATFTGISHVDFSVSDVEASAEWYCRVLGLDRVHRADLEGRTMIVLVHGPTALIIGLNQHSVAPVTEFDERNFGLDHIGFAVTAREDLTALERHLVELDVEHSPVEDTPLGSALVFRDPDNIQLEFWWTKQ